MWLILHSNAEQIGKVVFGYFQNYRNNLIFIPLSVSPSLPSRCILLVLLVSFHHGVHRREDLKRSLMLLALSNILEGRTDVGPYIKFWVFLFNVLY